MHPLRRLIADERGSASIEALVGGVLLMVPIFYLVIVLAQIQSQSFGLEAASRYLARMIAQNPSVSVTAGSAAIVAEQYGVDPALLNVEIACDTAVCPSPGAIVTVRVSTTVSLPLVPSFIAGSGPVGIPIEAFSSQKISEYVATP